LNPPLRGSSKTGWQAKLASLLFAFFCFELGAFFIVFPWTTYWDHHAFSWIAPDSPKQLALAQWWHGMWLSPAFRGAVSGLGLVNLYIAFVSVFRLRRYATPSPVEEPPISIE
jgi:hypothetical protein